MNDAPAMDRSRLFAAADRLIARQVPEEEARPVLEGIFESLYRLADAPQHLAELEARLDSYARRVQAARPWRALVRLARKPSGEPLDGALESLDASLPRTNDRATLVLKTEAARHLHRIVGDARPAWVRIAGELLPDATFGDVAAETVIVRLRLAAAAGAWEDHDRLADTLSVVWAGTAAQRNLAWIATVVAEHEIQRGAYAAAFQRLLPLEREVKAALRWAALGVRLHALLACGVDQPGTALRQETDRTAALLEPLLEFGEPEGGLFSDAEWRERRRRCELLLHYAGIRGRPTADGQGLTLSDALALETQDPRAALALTEDLLLAPDIEEAPEIALRCKLLWIRLTLAVSPAGTVESCEDLASTVLAEAQVKGLPVLEMLAWDQRALIRARYSEDRWDEAVCDAGRAANLALDLLALNQGSLVERSLRATLLPVLDRAVELLAEGALRALSRAPGDAAMHERFGRAILDYAEESMELALSEARNRMRSGEPVPPPRVVPGASKRSEDLQAPLRLHEAVLQYFLVGRYLLVFAYGQDFFTWQVEPIQNLENQPIRFQDRLEKLLAGLGATVPPQEEKKEEDFRHGEIRRDVKGSGVRRNAVLGDETVQKLGDHLLPPRVRSALESHRVRRLAIVPHDTLYRVPFSRLPWSTARLGSRFSLSLHPTGGLAGTHSSWQASQRRTRIGFFIGPDLRFATHEAQALRRAFRWAAKVMVFNTVTEKTDFGQAASNCKVLYLACHGHSPKDKPGDAYLLLGPPGEKMTLSQAAGLDLHHCGLAVLQACWTGWMDHVREFPVQGFPQGLRDAGVAAVVAPMFPVADPLCPLFTSVFCRILRFLPIGDALGYTLEVLRRNGETLAADIPEAAKIWKENAFDDYEYRLTGDLSVRLMAGWWGRQTSRLQFYGWMEWRMLRRAYRTWRAKRVISARA